MNDNNEKQKILVVDDSPENVRLLVELLKNEYEITVATSGEQALRRVESDTLPDLILLDVIMPGIDGYEVCARLKERESTRTIPIIFLSSLDTEGNEARGLELGAVDYITKPISPSIVRARIRNHLELKNHRDRLEELVRERTRELEQTQAVTFMSLGTLAEFRDPETGGHIQRTAQYVHLLCEELAKTEKYRDILTRSVIDQLTRSAPLHDIGKVGIPDAILLKPGKLTEKEFDTMRTHAYMGYKALKRSTMMLGGNSFLDYAMDVAYSHHERWNGNGYPRGLSGEDIPLAGRIMILADVYDALTSVRPYKPAFSHETSKNIMVTEMQGHFDPEILGAFLDIEDLFRAVAQALADDGTHSLDANI
jgi:putative two-component system response regulator